MQESNELDFYFIENKNKIQAKKIKEDANISIKE